MLFSALNQNMTVKLSSFLVSHHTKMYNPLKVMPPILLCWPTMLEVDAGGTAVEVERPCQ
jgi:hypothetical protein